MTMSDQTPEGAARDLSAGKRRGGDGPFKMRFDKRPPTTRAARAVAFHAAGHAVTAYIVGFPIETVSVLHPCRRKSRDAGPLSRDDFDAHAVATLGGVVAEAAITKVPVEVALARDGHEDLDTLISDLRYLFFYGDRAPALLDALERTVGIVMQPGVWPTICAVAGLLRRQGVVSASELAAVFAALAGAKRQAVLDGVQSADPDRDSDGGRRHDAAYLEP